MGKFCAQICTQGTFQFSIRSLQTSILIKLQCMHAVQYQTKIGDFFREYIHEKYTKGSRRLDRKLSKCFAKGCKSCSIAMKLKQKYYCKLIKVQQDNFILYL